MTLIERLKKIQESQKLIEELLDPASFVLNKQIEELQQQIKLLQDDCPHEFIDGVCKYCQKEEIN